MARLAGKLAFVTGAGGGIGRAVCQLFLAEGARVAASDVDVEAVGQAVGDATDDGRAIALRCDVGDSDSVREALEIAVREFGNLNVLCNVAGGSSSRDGIVTEVADKEFWRVIRVDLFGTFASCKHGLPELMRAGGGR
jgi:NAD(P)-dependent dehydrogenase (short-subunit alcohol dehydrogenase family)